MTALMLAPTNARPATLAKDFYPALELDDSINRIVIVPSFDTITNGPLGHGDVGLLAWLFGLMQPGERGMVVGSHSNDSRDLLWPESALSGAIATAVAPGMSFWHDGAAAFADDDSAPRQTRIGDPKDNFMVIVHEPELFPQGPGYSDEDWAGIISKRWPIVPLGLVPAGLEPLDARPVADHFRAGRIWATNMGTAAKPWYLRQAVVVTGYGSNVEAEVFKMLPAAPQYDRQLRWMRQHGCWPAAGRRSSVR